MGFLGLLYASGTQAETQQTEKEIANTSNK